LRVFASKPHLPSPKLTHCSETRTQSYVVDLRNDWLHSIDCENTIDTGCRPYRCKECQRTFSRQDSLARHEKLHSRKDTHNYPSPPSPPSSLISQSSLATSLSPFGGTILNSLSPATNGNEIDIHTSHSEQNTPIENMFNIPQSADLDFDLIWPDSEDLFETLMASENTNQWQMPFATLPITSHTFQMNNSGMETGNVFGDKVKSPSIGTIPTGESRRAVHNVSEMVSSLVSGKSHFSTEIS
jgi:Zinc finger, C2H2 type